MNSTLCSDTEVVFSIACKNKGYKNITTHKNIFRLIQHAVFSDLRTNLPIWQPSSIISTRLTFKTFISTYLYLHICH